MKVTTVHKIKQHDDLSAAYLHVAHLSDVPLSAGQEIPTAAHLLRVDELGSSRSVFVYLVPSASSLVAVNNSGFPRASPTNILSPSTPHSFFPHTRYEGDTPSQAVPPKTHPHGTVAVDPGARPDSSRDCSPGFAGD